MTPQTTIDSRPAPAPAAAAQQQAPAATGPTAAELQAIREENEALKSQVNQHQETARYWADKAKNGGEPKPAAAAAAEGEDEDLLELITTKGAKGLEAFMAKRGFVKASDVDARVNTKAGQIAKEQELFTRYPELGDKSTPFFIRTAEVYGQLKERGVDQTVAMEMAAEKTELEFIRSGKRKTPAQQSDDDKAAREQARLDRISAQAGDRDNRGAADAGDDDKLTDEQKRICKAMGITEEAFIARAKKGVAVKSK